MHRIGYSLLFFFFGVGLSCAGAPLGNRLVECLTDPAADLIWCDGKPVAWKDAGRLVCHSLEQHEEYLERRRK